MPPCHPPRGWTKPSIAPRYLITWSFQRSLSNPRISEQTPLPLICGGSLPGTRIKTAKGGSRTYQVAYVCPLKKLFLCEGETRLQHRNDVLAPYTTHQRELFLTFTCTNTNFRPWELGFAVESFNQHTATTYRCCV